MTYIPWTFSWSTTPLTLDYPEDESVDSTILERPLLPINGVGSPRCPKDLSRTQGPVLGQGHPLLVYPSTRKRTTDNQYCPQGPSPPLALLLDPRHPAPTRPYRHQGQGRPGRRTGEKSGVGARHVRQ